MEEAIRIGGVPEHFNLPIHLAMENESFQKRGVEVQWTDFYGGTGEMTRAMRKGDCDLCIVLTEGIIADIVDGFSRDTAGILKMNFHLTEKSL